jgi:hypothetical protein
MKWGIETFVRIIFKTAILFLFFLAGFLVNEKIKYIRSDREWYEGLKKDTIASDIVRGGYVSYPEIYSRKDSLRDDSLRKIYR